MVESSILYFFLLVLKILFNLSLDISCKQDKFSKILQKKSLKFISKNSNGTILFNLSLVLFLVEVNFISKKQSFKKNVLVVNDTSYIKKIFALLTKIIAFYI